MAGFGKQFEDEVDLRVMVNGQMLRQNEMTLSVQQLSVNNRMFIRLIKQVKKVARGEKDT